MLTNNPRRRKRQIWAKYRSENGEFSSVRWDENSQKTKKTIQSLLSDFQITDFKTNMTRYDVYYSFKNKNYLFNVVSTCNEYMPKRSCEDEKQQLNNLINNLIFY